MQRTLIVAALVFFIFFLQSIHAGLQVCAISEGGYVLVNYSPSNDPETTCGLLGMTPAAITKQSFRYSRQLAVGCLGYPSILRLGSWEGQSTYSDECFALRLKKTPGTGGAIIGIDCRTNLPILCQLGSLGNYTSEVTITQTLETTKTVLVSVTQPSSVELTTLIAEDVSSTASMSVFNFDAFLFINLTYRMSTADIQSTIFSHSNGLSPSSDFYNIQPSPVETTYFTSLVESIMTIESLASNISSANPYITESVIHTDDSRTLSIELGTFSTQPIQTLAATSSIINIDSFSVINDTVSTASNFSSDSTVSSISETELTLTTAYLIETLSSFIVSSSECSNTTVKSSIFMTHVDISTITTDTSVVFSSSPAFSSEYPNSTVESHVSTVGACVSTKFTDSVAASSSPLSSSQYSSDDIDTLTQSVVPPIISGNQIVSSQTTSTGADISDFSKTTDKFMESTTLESVSSTSTKFNYAWEEWVDDIYVETIYLDDEYDYAQSSRTISSLTQSSISLFTSSIQGRSTKTLISNSITYTATVTMPVNTEVVIDDLISVRNTISQSTNLKLSDIIADIASQTDGFALSKTTNAWPISAASETTLPNLPEFLTESKPSVSYGVGLYDNLDFDEENSTTNVVRYMNNPATVSEGQLKSSTTLPRATLTIISPATEIPITPEVVITETYFENNSTVLTPSVITVTQTVTTVLSEIPCLPETVTVSVTVTISQT